MTRPSILVSRRWPSVVEAQMAERFDVTYARSSRPLRADEFREAMTCFDAVLPSATDHIDEQAFDIIRPQTRLLANCGVDCAHIDVASARAHGIQVTNTHDELSDSAADLAITLMLMLTHGLRAEAWDGWGAPASLGAALRGRTLGVIGFGRIGREVARRARHGFGMNVIAHDRTRIAEADLARLGAERAETLEALLREADIVSLHCDDAAANRRLIDGPRLDLMKPGAFLVNTAHGDLVDAQALSHALWFECIGGAGFDAAAGGAGAGRVAGDNVLTLPRTGPSAAAAREAMGLRVVENITDFFEGRAPRDLVA